MTVFSARLRSDGLEVAEDDHYGAIVKLLILTGQRESEIAVLHWSKVDFSRDLICLPKERTKNGRAHDVPLARIARDLLQTQVKIEGRRYVFGRGEGPFSGFQNPKRPWTRGLLRQMAKNFRTGRCMICGARRQPEWPILAYSRTSSRPCSIM